MPCPSARVRLEPGWQGRPRGPARRTGAGRNVLIVGAGPVGRELAATLERENIDGRTVVGFLDETETLAGDVLGRVGNLAQIARAEFVDEIILAIPNQHDLTMRVIREARRNRLDIRACPRSLWLRVGPRVGRTRRLGLEYFGDLPVLTLHEEKAPASALFWKRRAGYCAFRRSLCCWPLRSWPPSPSLIKAASPGQVFYQAKRVGLKGRRFILLQVSHHGLRRGRAEGKPARRTTSAGALASRLPLIHVSPRVGQFLRRYSLDELPQLWNVLRGEMSLVGPRPHPLDDFEHYRLEHLRRLDVTPGITGLWQVTARARPVVSAKHGA